MADDHPGERAQGWLATLTPWLERGTPVTLLVLLVLGGLTLWLMAKEIQRMQVSQNELVHLLLAEKEKEVQLALRIGACEGKGSRGEAPHAAPPIPTLDPVPWDVRTWQCAAF